MLRQLFRRLRLLIALFVGLAGVGSGCAGGPTLVASDVASVPEFPPHASEAPDDGFPPPEALRRIASEPVASVATDRLSPVASYTVPGPLPVKWTTQSPTPDRPTRFLIKTLVAKRHRATQAGRCAARALARFIGLHGAKPTPALEAHILGKCRAHWSAVSYGWIISKAKTRLSLPAWQEHVTPELAEMIDKAGRTAGPIDFGLATAKVGGKKISLLVYGRRGVEIASVTRSRNGQSFTIEGKLLAGASTVVGFVNQGPSRVGRCRVASVARGFDFTATCPTEAGDDDAWIELAAVGDNKKTGKMLARLLVSPSGQSQARYAATVVEASSKPTRSVDAWREYLFTSIERVRAKADLAAVALDESQSEVVQRVAPHYFSERALPAGSERFRKLVHGLRAGWSVDATVRFGEIVSAVSAPSDGPEALLAALFDRPSVRSVLMRPDVRRLAIAPYWGPDNSYVGVVMAAYATVDDVAPPKLQADVADQLNRARRRQGLGSYRAWGLMADVRRLVVDALVEDRLTGSDARSWLVDRYGPPSRWGVEGVLLRAHRLEELPWPREVLEDRAPTLDLVASYRRPRGHAWARYEVILLIKQP